jgi:hypothetical protein
MAKTRLPRADVPPGQMLDTAHFVCGLTAHLEAMAKAAGLDVLAYFLGMAKGEGEAFIKSASLSEGHEGCSAG